MFLRFFLVRRGLIEMFVMFEFGILRLPLLEKLVANRRGHVLISVVEFVPFFIIVDFLLEPYDKVFQLSYFLYVLANELLLTR